MLRAAPPAKSDLGRSTSREVPDIMAVYSENQSFLPSTVEVFSLQLFASDPGSGSPLESLVFSHEGEVPFIPALSAFNLPMSATQPQGWVIYPLSDSPSRLFRAECRWASTGEMAAEIRGTARVTGSPDVMTQIDSPATPTMGGPTTMWIHVHLGRVASIVLRFRPLAPVLVPSVSTTPGEMSEAPKPLSLHLLTNTFEEDFKRDAWKVLEKDGAAIADRLKGGNVVGDAVMVEILVDAIANQKLLINMIREPKMRPSVVTLFQAIRDLKTQDKRETLLGNLFQSVDFGAVASEGQGQRKPVFEYLVEEFCNKDDHSSKTVSLVIASGLAPMVSSKIQEPTFANSLSLLVNSKMSGPLIRLMLLEIIQSPVLVKNTATMNAEGAGMLKSIILRSDCLPVVEDFARTFGFGRKRLVIAVGTNEHGSSVLTEVIRRSAQLPTEQRGSLFDFREALNESVTRLAVHPHGAKVVRECLDQPFFRDFAMVRLFTRHPQDLLPRAARVLLYGLEKEADTSKRQWYAELVMRHAGFLTKDERDKFAAMTK